MNPSLSLAKSIVVFSKALMLIGIMVLGSTASAGDKKSLVILPFGLVDSLDEGTPFPEKKQRLSEATELLKSRFREEALYDIVDSEQINQEIERQLKRYDLHDCNGCELEIASVAAADRVLLAWAQRATSLILNINIEIRDATNGETLLRKSAEIRGNTQANWRRAIKHIVRSMVAKNQGGR